jgi:hypothetical protein
MPFHAFLTVWLSSAVSHYTALRLWKEVILVLLAIGAVWLLCKDRDLRKQLMSSKLMWLIGAYTLVQLIWGAVAYMNHAVTAKALGYGLLVNLRFLVFFVIVWLVASRTPWLRQCWQKLILLPAAAVIGIGLLQRFVLPHDVLKHFGYGRDTIPAYETIDHKVQYLRIQSTLRGANLLGAYLVLVLSVLYTAGRRWWRWAGLAAGLIVLFCSGSRGAWIGAAAALFVLGFMTAASRIDKRWLVGGLVLVAVVGIGGIVALRNNDVVQNVLFHTDEHSHSAVSSNSAHFSASKDALVQVVHEPLGRGPGTAGPASVYNNGHASRIAENYFLQIGQEVGWIGLAAFLALYIYIGQLLWARRNDELARSLFAAFVGISCVAMLMHIWTDDTVAYLWWGLAGLALAPTFPHLEDGPLDRGLGQNNRIVKSREKSAQTS